MNIVDLLDENLDIQDKIIGEGFTISPIVAYATFKEKAFNALLKNKAFSRALGKTLSKAEAKKAISGKTSGKGDNATVYKFTDEQKEILKFFKTKYGKDITKQIKDFRNNVMAPYQIIKRNVASSKSLTNKEIYGMTREEYLRYKESGRKKIENRGETYFSRNRELEKILDKEKEDLSKMENTLLSLKKGEKIDIPKYELEKILDKLDLGISSLGGYSLEELKKTYDKINYLEEAVKKAKNNNRKFLHIRDKDGGMDESISEVEDKISQLKEKGYSAIYNREQRGRDDRKVSSFKTSYSNYLIRRSLLEDKGNKAYIKTYEKLLDEYVRKGLEKTSNTTRKILDGRKNIELNKMEKKIWARKNPLISSMSNDINDYILKIKDEDFEPIKYYKKPKEVEEAEKAIDAEVKRFEREMAKIVAPEDLIKLRKYRLINNPITVRELKNPSELFASEVATANE